MRLLGREINIGLLLWLFPISGSPENRTLAPVGAAKPPRAIGSVTTPVNKNSIAFPARMGLTMRVKPNNRAGAPPGKIS